MPSYVRAGIRKCARIRALSGDGRYTLNLSDELFHSVEKRFIDCLAELTKLM